MKQKVIEKYEKLRSKMNDSKVCRIIVLLLISLSLFLISENIRSTIKEPVLVTKEEYIENTVITKEEKEQLFSFEYIGSKYSNDEMLYCYENKILDIVVELDVYMETLLYEGKEITSTYKNTENAPYKSSFLFGSYTVETKMYTHYQIPELEFDTYENNDKLDALYDNYVKHFNEQKTKDSRSGNWFYDLLANGFLGFSLLFVIIATYHIHSILLKHSLAPYMDKETKQRNQKTSTKQDKENDEIGGIHE